ncbi:MAG: methyltransferase domain-containing protein [Anaerolineae bacterium]|nr:methyltransferase domain-containing protein [Anaerolineae bacterium]
MTNSNPFTDRDLLTQQAYATDEHLGVRYRTHELYSYPKIDFAKWVVDLLPWRGDEQVLDIGSGPGSYFQYVKEHTPDGWLVAGDLSFGMAVRARQSSCVAHVPVLNLDAQQLPFEDNSFDVVLANHMLFHVPDIDQTLREIRRVLRDSGCLVATTNSESTMPEFDTLTRRACTLLGYSMQEFKPVHHRFTLENAPILLGRYFRAVARHDLPSEFHFPEPEPVLTYLNSGRATREAQLPDGVAWDSFMEIMDNQVKRLIRHFGELQVHKLAGVLVATNGGGFAETYLKYLNGAT